jgi:hypothetical protein
MPFVNIKVTPATFEPPQPNFPATERKTVHPVDEYFLSVNRRP